MKKIRIVSFIIILGILGYLAYQKWNKPVKSDITEIAVNDPSIITKIELKDREGNEIILTKKEGIWHVNDMLPVFLPKIESLLNETLKNIRIKGPVAKTAQKNVVRKLVGHSIHVQLFQGSERIRDYYVGSPNPDRSSTYIYIEGSETPFEAHIFGFASLLEPKFSTNPQDWFNKTIFDFKPDDISSIEVMNNEIPEESFQLSKKDSFYNISPTLTSLSQSASRSYFSLFSFKNLEGYANYLSVEQKDSIKNTQPFITIKVNPIQGKSIALNLYRKGDFKIGNNLYDKQGQVILEDTERYFATFTDFPYLVTVQDYTMGKLLVKRSYFRSDF